jgi:hypothetical protein
LPILELFGLEIAAFGRIVANSAEIGESLLADRPLQKYPFSLLGESKSGFGQKILCGSRSR